MTMTPTNSIPRAMHVGEDDLPFLAPDLHIVVCDPHRPGHELSYHPGETNVRMADVPPKHC